MESGERVFSSLTYVYETPFGQVYNALPRIRPESGKLSRTGLPRKLMRVPPALHLPPRWFIYVYLGISLVQLADHETPTLESLRLRGRFDRGREAARILLCLKVLFENIDDMALHVMREVIRVY